MKANNKTLRMTFNEEARLYDEIRPGYPESLIEDVIKFSEIPEGGDILEIGCGTGQATRPFAERGYSMLCLDIGKDLVAIAANNFRNFHNVTFIVKSFEDWEPKGQTFDMIIAATSFRWIDPAIRYVKAASVLKPSGTLAVFSNKHIGKNEGFFAEVQTIYQKCAPSIFQPALDKGVKKKNRAISMEETSLFEMLVRKRYPWSTEYTAEEYIKLLNTYSNHRNLSSVERQELFTGIKKLIKQKYRGRIFKHYEAVLELGRKIAS